ncbi:MAG TPA: histone family protein [Nitrososphaeraceae archaeon]|jgi:histone H3/H4|nr:histone family protein [Nitrososphaeraceae archaeon]
MTEYPELGLAGMYRIIKKSGGERVSEEAADQLRRILETIAIKISDQAVDLCIHAGRKTIKGEDIQLAAKNLLNLIH